MRLSGRVSLLVVAVLVCLAGSGSAAAQAHPEAIPVPRVLDTWVSKTEQLVVPAADALPEELYGFRPTAGSFTGVRSFAEQVSHLAAANFQLGSKILGEAPPAGTRGETAPEAVRTKPQIMEYLKGSFACLHRAAAHINGQNLETPIVVGRETDTAVGLIVDALLHASDHYGQIVEYLRMNGVIPPASR